MRVLSVVEKSEHANLRNPDSYRVPGSPERSQERVFLPSQLRLYVAHLMAKFEELGSRGIHKGSLLGHRGREECGNARGPSGSETLAIMTQTLQNDLPLWRHSGRTARATA